MAIYLLQVSTQFKYISTTFTPTSVISLYKMSTDVSGYDKNRIKLQSRYGLVDLAIA